MWGYAYHIGFFLIGSGGLSVFVSTVSFANFFSKFKGLATSALVGAFDSSSGVFVGLNLVTTLGATLSQCFAVYAVIPFITFITILLLWPRDVVALLEERPQTQESVGQPLRNAISDLPLAKQLMTSEFWLLVWTASVGMVSINFFIGSVNDQMVSVNQDTAKALSQAFAVILPLGGIFSIPVVGLVMDKLGPVNGVLVFWVTLLAFTVLNSLYTATAMQALAYAAFVAVAFCRPLFYTLIAVFTGHVFGFASFGTLYGFVMTCAGVANLGVGPLHAFGQSRSFLTTNIILVCVQATIIALWFKMQWASMKRLVAACAEATVRADAPRALGRLPPKAEIV